MVRSYIFPVTLLLFSFSIICLFLIVVPFANAGLPGPCGLTGSPGSDCQNQSYCEDNTVCCQTGNCPDDTSCYWTGTECVNSPSCEATVKCVCEGKFSGATRVVPCPADPFPPGFLASSGPKGTLGVDCSIPLTETPALCENLDIHCGRREKPNCLLTLPIHVPQPTPPPT